MREIQIKTDKEIERLIIDEYVSVLGTMDIEYSLFLPYSYVPNIFDSIGAFKECNEEAFDIILHVYRDHCLFFKCNGLYFNKPIEEVW